MTEREVVMRLTVKHEQASAALKDTAAQAQKVSAAARDMQAQLDRPTGGASGRNFGNRDFATEAAAASRRLQAEADPLRRQKPGKPGFGERLATDDPLDQNGILRAARPLFLANILTH